MLFLGRRLNLAAIGIEYAGSRIEHWTANNGPSLHHPRIWPRSNRVAAGHIFGASQRHARYREDSR